MQEYLPVISLLVLVFVVAIGFIKKINLGFFALGAAFVLGTVGGMRASQITAGFSSSMFVTLVGVTFMFGMASQNGTLELFSCRKAYGLDSHTYVRVIRIHISHRTRSYRGRNINDNFCNVSGIRNGH